MNFIDSTLCVYNYYKFDGSYCPQKPTLITHTLYIQEHVMKAQEIVMTAQGIASSNIATSKVEVTLSTYSSYMGYINRVSANAV